MYKITLQTTEGIIDTEIDSLDELNQLINYYQKIYLDCSASYVEGPAKHKFTPEKKEYTYDKSVKITDFDINWKKIKNACMTTVSKQAGDKEPSNEWKQKLLMAEHSPLRRGSISWKWENIPYAISTHFVRHHEGVEKWVGTQRADRTDIKDRSERSQMNTVPMEMEANIQAIINISLKRLCTCADPLTRAYWQEVILAIKEYDENIYRQCVPQCIRCGGCPELFSPCGFFEKFAENLTKEELINMQTRYDKYNEYRAKSLKK